MQIALALYPQFTILDIIGPFQVLADVPGHEVVLVAAQAGPVVDGLDATTRASARSRSSARTTPNNASSNAARSSPPPECRAAPTWRSPWSPG